MQQMVLKYVLRIKMERNDSYIQNTKTADLEGNKMKKPWLPKRRWNVFKCMKRAM